MKIKDYRCKCGHDDFFFGDDKRTNQIGIYCSLCGKWLKWANKDERNLYVNHVSTNDKPDLINREKISSGDVLDKLRAEIEQEPYVSKMEVLDIIDEYIAESEVEKISIGDVLDELRAEIDGAKLPKNRMCFFRDGIECALQIIDEYRAERM